MPFFPSVLLCCSWGVLVRAAATMVLIAPSVDGAMFGFGVMCYSNGVRRMRIFRRAQHQSNARRCRHDVRRQRRIFTSHRSS